MTTETQSEKPARKKGPKVSSRGGYRPGSGRPKGSTTKVTLDDLMANIAVTGKVCVTTTKRS